MMDHVLNAIYSLKASSLQTRKPLLRGSCFFTRSSDQASVLKILGEFFVIVSSQLRRLIKMDTVNFKFLKSFLLMVIIED